MTDLESITQEYLKSILHYDPETGEWRWLPRPVHMFKEGDGKYTAKRNAAIWNKRFAGKLAGHHNADGYLMIRINGRYRYFAHILAFIYTQNGYNKRLQRNNTSGHKGVDWHKAAQKWRASIKINGKKVHLGLFDKIEDAIARRKEAAEELHGDFVRHG